MKDYATILLVKILVNGSVGGWAVGGRATLGLTAEGIAAQAQLVITKAACMPPCYRDSQPSWGM